MDHQVKSLAILFLCCVVSVSSYERSRRVYLPHSNYPISCRVSNNDNEQNQDEASRPVLESFVEQTSSSISEDLASNNSLLFFWFNATSGQYLNETFSRTNRTLLLDFIDGPGQSTSNNVPVIAGHHSFTCLSANFSSNLSVFLLTTWRIDFTPVNLYRMYDNNFVVAICLGTGFVLSILLIWLIWTYRWLPSSNKTGADKAAVSSEAGGGVFIRMPSPAVVQAAKLEQATSALGGGPENVVASAAAALRQVMKPVAEMARKLQQNHALRLPHLPLALMTRRLSKPATAAASTSTKPSVDVETSPATTTGEQSTPYSTISMHISDFEDNGEDSTVSTVTSRFPTVESLAPSVTPMPAPHFPFRKSHPKKHHQHKRYRSYSDDHLEEEPAGTISALNKIAVVVEPSLQNAHTTGNVAVESAKGKHQVRWSAAEGAEETYHF